MKDIDKKQGPVFSHRRGRLTLTIWSNQTDHGTRYSTEITRTWKDGEEYKTTTRLDERDLLVAARVATIADDWVSERRQAERESASGAALSDAIA